MSNNAIIQLRVMRFEDRNNGEINFGAENEIGKALLPHKEINLIVNGSNTYLVKTHATEKGRLVNMTDVFNGNMIGAGTKLICSYEEDTMTLNIRTDD